MMKRSSVAPQRGKRAGSPRAQAGVGVPVVPRYVGRSTEE
jgi:hypothetical protein